MKRKRLPPDDPREWINRAKSNLARAGLVVPGVYLENLCFDAQQAAEKAIKAIFVHRRETFPYVHDLDRLLGLLQRQGLRIPRYVREAKELTRFASRPRYPEWIARLLFASSVARCALRRRSYAGPKDGWRSHEPRRASREIL